MPEAQPASGQRTSRRDVWTAFGVVVSAIGIIATIWPTSKGWRQTAQDQIELERTKANVQLINDQIRYLYGPIYGYMRASTESWREFRKQYRPGKPFWGSKPD